VTAVIPPERAAFEAFQSARAANNPMMPATAWTHPAVNGARDYWRAAAQAAIEADPARAELAEERAERLHRTGERDEARSDLARLGRILGEVLDAFKGSPARVAAWRARADAITGRHARKAAAEQDAQPARELAAAMRETRQVREQLAEILGWFRNNGSSGRYARVSGTVLAREYKRAGVPLPDDLKHLDGQ